MNKNILIACLMLLLVNQVAAIDAADVLLGGSGQERGQEVTATWTITNTGASPLTGLELTLLGAGAKYKLAATLPGTTLGAGQSMEIPVKGFVPLDLDAVDSNGRKISIAVAQLRVEGAGASGTEVRTVTVRMEAENKLEFGSGTQVTVDGDTTRLRDGKELDEVKRGSSVEVAVEAENQFDDNGDCSVDSGDCDIEDIEATLESQDSDMDVDEDFDFGTIRADRADSDSVSFTVDSDIDDGTYDFDLWMTGRDENGALHGDRMEFSLNVEVAADEVTIADARLSPSSLSCNQTRTTLTVTLENTGRDDQDRAAILVESSRLDIKDSIYRIEVEEGDSVSKTFDLTVPKGLPPGQYFIQVIGMVDNSEETDRQSATLTVGECQAQVQPPAVQPPASGGSSTDVNIINPTATSMIVDTPKPQGQSDSNQGILILAGLGLLALLMLLILIVLLVRR